MLKPNRLALIAIPFQFAVAHALGYGVARLITPTWAQMTGIVIGNTIGITVVGFAAERFLKIERPRATRVAVTAFLCMAGVLLVSQMPDQNYETLVLPNALGLLAFHLASRLAP